MPGSPASSPKAKARNIRHPDRRVSRSRASAAAAGRRRLPSPTRCPKAHCRRSSGLAAVRPAAGAARGSGSRRSRRRPGDGVMLPRSARAGGRRGCPAACGQLRMKASAAGKSRDAAASVRWISTFGWHRPSSTASTSPVFRAVDETRIWMRTAPAGDTSATASRTTAPADVPLGHRDGRGYPLIDNVRGHSISS